ncbi:MAG: pilus assembly protein [Nitrospirota bacterium]|nr:pilus assembly protein [Nitrospirota bacterium]
MNVYWNQRLEKLRKSERGAAAIEFALILPVLASILFGTIDFGRMMWFQEVLANATRVGARQATLFQAGNGQAAVQNVIANSLTAGGVPAAGLAVQVTGAGFALGQAGLPAFGQPVNVNAQVPFNFIVIDRLVPGVNNGRLTASVTMMME